MANSNSMKIIILVSFMIFECTSPAVPKRVIFKKFPRSNSMIAAITGHGLVPIDGPVFVKDEKEKLRKILGLTKKAMTKRCKGLNKELFLFIFKNRILPDLKKLYPNDDFKYLDDAQFHGRLYSADINKLLPKPWKRIPIPKIPKRSPDILAVEYVHRDLKTHLKNCNCSTPIGHKKDVNKWWRGKNASTIEFLKNNPGQEPPVNEYCKEKFKEMIIKLELCEINSGGWVFDSQYKEYKQNNE